MQKKVRARRCVASVVLIGAVNAALGARSFAATTPESWNSTSSGNWATPSLWSPNFNYPNNGTPGGATYDALINAIGSAYTVTLSSNVTVDSLTLNSANATLTQSGAVLSAVNGVSVQAGVYKLGGTLLNTTLTVAGGATVAVDSGVMDNVIVNGNLQLGQSSPGTFYASHSFALNGTLLVGNAATSSYGSLGFGVGAVGNQAVSGSANIIFGFGGGNSMANANHGMVTLGANVVIHGTNGQIFNSYTDGQIVNQGKISADVSGGAIHLGNTNGTVLSSGTLEAKNGGILVLGGTWSNTGTINVNNGTVYLGGTFGAGDIGTFTRSGGTVVVNGTLDASAAALNLNAGTGSWFLQNGTIKNGIVNTSGGAAIVPDNGVLDHLTINGDVQLGQTFSATMYINGNTTINGNVLVGSTTTSSFGSANFGLGAVASQTILGNANIAFGNNGTNNIVNLNHGTLTFGANLVLHGTNGQMDNGYADGQIINQGKISADVSGGAISIGNNGTFTNTGTLEAKNGGTLTVRGPWSSSGVMNVNGGTLNLAGTFTTAGLGTVTRTGGTINIFGTLDNTSNTLNLNATTGSWVLGSNGVIRNGTVNTSGGAVLNIGNGGRLDGVTVNGEVDVNTSSALLRIQNSIVGNGTIFLGNAAGSVANDLVAENGSSGGPSLLGTGTLVLGGSGTNTIHNSSSGTLTIGPGFTIHGKNGQIFNESTGQHIVNQGTISADVAGGQILIANSFNGDFTNAGVFSASNGGTLVMSNNGATLANLSGGTLTGGTWNVGAGSAISFQTAAISTNAANISLSGVGSAFTAINNFTTNSGSFTVGAGRSFNAAANFNNTSTGVMNAINGGVITFTTGQNNGIIDSQPGGTINFTGNFSHNVGSTLRGSGAVFFTGGVQQFDGTLVGDIDLNMNGATPTFGSSFNGSVASMSITAGVTTYAAGAKITVGVGGLNFSGAASPSLQLGTGSSPATLTLNGDVNVSSNTTGLKQILATVASGTDGTLDLGASLPGSQPQPRVFTVAQGTASPDLLIAARITDGAVRKSGTGMLAFTNANTYAGGTTIATGILQSGNIAALGTGPVTFAGGQLSLRSDDATNNYANTLALTSSSTSMLMDIGATSTGASNLFHFGSTTMGIALSLSGTGTLQFAGATLGNNLSVTNFATLDFNGPIDGGSFTMTGSTGAGTTIFSGSTANTYAGLTRWNAGTLQLNKTTVVNSQTVGVTSVAGDLSVFTGGTVQWMASDQVANTSTLTINGSSSTANLNSQSNTIGAITMTGGTLSLGSGTMTVNGAFTVNTSTATANITGSGKLIAGSANIQSNTTRSGGGVTKVTGMPTIASGKKLDLTDTRLVVAGGTLGAWNNVTSSYDGLTQMIATGRNGGAWNGTQIVTSMTAAIGVSALTTLGVAKAGDISKSSFGGLAVSSGDVLAMYTYTGDANLNGAIDGDDYFRIDSGFAGHGSGFENGDFNYDGKINADDYFLIDENYSKHGGAFADAPGIGLSGVSAVPEPSAIGMIGAAALVGSRRRKRR